MTDIVERLRGRADRYRQLWGNAAYYTEGDALFDEKTADTITTLRAEVERLERTSEYWKAEHLAGNDEIERLRAALEEISLMDKAHEHDLFSATCVARAALAEEKKDDR